MKRTYFFNLLKMKMLSIRLIISVFCMVFMNFLVVMPDIRANYDTLDIVYLFRFTYDIGSFSRLLPLLAAFVMADAVAQDFCDHTMPFLLARMDDKTYINCNYIVCAVSGFVTIAAGWGAFVLLLRIRYPFLAAGSDNLETIKDVMLKLTCDEAIMKQITMDTQDYTNNEKAMNEIASSDYKSDFLGGQNHIALFAEAATKIDMSNAGPYDQGLNESFQNAFKDYFTGNVQEDAAKANFETAIKEKYPELTDVVWPA